MSDAKAKKNQQVYESNWIELTWRWKLNQFSVKWLWFYYAGFFSLSGGVFNFWINICSKRLSHWSDSRPLLIGLDNETYLLQNDIIILFAMICASIFFFCGRVVTWVFAFLIIRCHFYMHHSIGGKKNTQISVWKSNKCVLIPLNWFLNWIFSSRFIKLACIPF